MCAYKKGRLTSKAVPLFHPPPRSCIWFSDRDHGCYRHLRLKLSWSRLRPHLLIFYFKRRYHRVHQTNGTTSHTPPPIRVTDLLQTIQLLLAHRQSSFDHRSLLENGLEFLHLPSMLQSEEMRCAGSHPSCWGYIDRMVAGSKRASSRKQNCEIVTAPAKEKKNLLQA